MSKVPPRGPNSGGNLLTIASGPQRVLPAPYGELAGQAGRGRGVPTPEAAPSEPRTLYERGLTCAAMDDIAGAVQALRQAVALDPSLGAAWARLGDLLDRSGDSEGASAAHAAAATAPSAPRPPRPRAPAKLEAAERQLRARLHGHNPDAIEHLLRTHLRDQPTDATALLILAQIGMEQGRTRQAERLLARALDLAPAYTQARHLHAVTLFRQGKEAQAAAAIAPLLAQDPRNIAYRTLLASSLAIAGPITRAIDIYETLIRDAPKRADLWLSYAQALKHAGRLEDSVRAFRTVLGFAPDSGQAHWGLQDLLTGMPAPEDVAAMRANLANAALTAENRFQFEYALAQALEKSGEFAESFAHYAAGAKLRRGQIAYNPDDITQRVRRAKAVFTAEFLASRAGQGCSDPAPIFILGMPRAGSTLIEQILASHSAVEGTRELPELGHLVQELGPRDAAGGVRSYPECLVGLGAASLAETGRLYIERTRIYRVTDRPYFIDKMPANWIDTGLIALVLPNARIIDARRDPMATCFAAFKKYFSQGQGFTYDLQDLGRYYNDYIDLMHHFDSVAPGRVHRVIYETLVDDTEGEIRRLLAYCGLEFQPACLRFWETKRVVSTASSQQVRRPIFRDGLDQWRNFEPWLGPLKASLKAGGDVPSPPDPPSLP